MHGSLQRTVTSATGGLAVLALFLNLTSPAKAEDPNENEPTQSTFAIRLAPWDSTRQVPMHLVGRIDRYYEGGYHPHSGRFGYLYSFDDTFDWVYSFERRWGPYRRSQLDESLHRRRTTESPGFTHPNFDHYESYGYGKYYAGYSPYTYY